MLDHRRAVGGLWEQMGTAHLAILKQQGLEPHHYLLEFGCGSLRGACRTIPYLEPDHYFAIEPARSLVEAGIKHEIPPAVYKSKRPTFSFSNEMRLATKDEEQRFDFIMSQAVFTHFGPEALERFLFFAKAKLADGGKIIISLHLIDDGMLNMGKPVFDALVNTANVKDIRDLPSIVFRTKVIYPYYLVQQIADVVGLDLQILQWRHPGKNKQLHQRMLLLTPR